MPDGSDRDVFALGKGTAEWIGGIRPVKYMQPGEVVWDESLRRMARGIFPHDERLQEEYYSGLLLRWICPAGRVMAGAGTDKEVTWINCFVASVLEDSMRSESGTGIMEALGQVAYSMQMGGGVGTDFSPLRPRGAKVHRMGTIARGVLRFMSMWNAMSRTVTSSGFRDGAMMATLDIDHPDVWNPGQYETRDGKLTSPSFISAKRQPGELVEFNMSILVSDAFMAARDADAEWQLGHWCEPFDPAGLVRVVQRFDPATGKTRPWYVYRVVPARQLWDDVMRSTYTYSEPGVIFVDRVNQWNNLRYCETIRCTNPCGEQPLPPHGCCDLSHVNLSRMVTDPFTDGAEVDYSCIRSATDIVVRSLDAVLDLTRWPLPEQEAEAQSKRRVGCGFTGLGNLFMFMGARYGSGRSVELAEEITRAMTHQAYRTSIDMARERGPFPAFDREAYLESQFVRERLPEDVRQGIAEFGIRNALLTSIAPTGTGSIAQGDNCSSGCEPVFSLRFDRKTKRPDGDTLDVTTVEDFGFRVYANVKFGGDADAALRAPLPDYMDTASRLSPRNHVAVQGAVQRWIDASVSKTVNVPTSTPFEEFFRIYDDAYEAGCKGCTTYRPDEASGRGSVLSEVKEPAPPVVTSGFRARPDVLEGRTYKLRWGGAGMYLVVGDEVMPDGRRVPMEVLLTSRNVDSQHWISALTRTITAVMRREADFSFLPEELMQVHSARGGEWIDGKYVPSEVALIGQTLRRHFIECGYMEAPDEPGNIEAIETRAEAPRALGRTCPDPRCGQPTVYRAEGCDKCSSCGWSSCG